LNSELPQNSRYHIIQQFNRGLIEIVIATDEKNESETPKAPKQKNESESEDLEDEELSDEFVMSEDDAENVDVDNDSFDMGSSEDNEAEMEAMNELGDDGFDEDETEGTEELPKKQTKKKSKHQNDKEYGVARGIDFKSIANIINFDFPETKENYVHRVGRTARAGEAGLAFSFVSPKEELPLEIVLRHQQSLGQTIVPYVFQVSLVEGFRYRVSDVTRSVTTRSIQEARLAEIKREILTSQKLKAHFEENPLDFESLQHDKELQSNKVPRHLAYVPDYLMPSKKELAQTLTPAELAEKLQDEKLRVAYSIRSLKQKKRDPLKSFERKQGTKRGRDGAPGAKADGRPVKRFKHKPKKAPKRRDKVSGKKFKSNAKKPF